MIKTNILALGVLFFFFSCIPEKKKEYEFISQKPNIIFILADDLGYGDLSCYGQKHFETPNIDKLAKEGISFTQHYSGSTVCAPSRSSLLTGLTSGHTPIRGNREIYPEGQHPLPKETITLPKLLKEAGYITGCYGKWGLGFPGSEGDPNQQGFDEFYGYNCQRFAHHYYPWHLWHNQRKVIIEENAGKACGSYGPGLVHQQALKFLEENKDTSFFMFYPSLIPHAELVAPDKYHKKFKGKFLPEVGYTGGEGGKGFRTGEYAPQAESHAAFAGMVNLLDDQVGEIMKKLDELGIADNTIVIFSSDNGPHLEGGADPDYFNSNGVLKGYKRDLYEGGIRVPMIIQWPNKIAPGTFSNHISAFWDILPTMAEVADFKTPQNLDGISFLPSLLQENSQEEHEYLYWEFHEMGGRLAIRKNNWKLVRYNVFSPEKITTELYNLDNDIGETKNVTNEHPKIVEELIGLMEQARTASPIFNFQP